MAAFTLAHLSDPHLPPMPAARFRDLASKRALGYLNWTRNRHKYHRREVLDALVADIRAQHPDHIAVTGDLVNLALEAEFAPSRAWLESVGAAEHVTVIPGNHDAYVRSTRHRAAEVWEDYIRGDEANGTAFPFLRRRGPVALIGVSSAVPTLPMMATGRLGPPQLEALERILAQLSTEQVFRVLLVHWRIRERFMRCSENTASSWCCTGTTTFTRRFGSTARPAASRQSACRRLPRSRIGIIRRPPSTCSRSSARTAPGAASRSCAVSIATCVCRS